MIESPLLIRMVDVLIVDHPGLYAFVALAFLQAYFVPQLLEGPGGRPPQAVILAALVWFLLSVVDFASGWRAPAEKRDVIVGLWVAAVIVGGWAWVGLLRYLLRLGHRVREEQALRLVPPM